MDTVSLGDFFTRPNVIFVASAMCAYAVNIVIGVCILPGRRTPGRLRAHNLMFWVILACYLGFLAFNQMMRGNTPLEYGVLGFLGVVYWSRKIDVTLHAIVSTLGLVLLCYIVAFDLL